jgi:hypothetical protein
MRYYCSKCKLAVIVFPGKEPIRACRCEAPIFAEMSAQPKGTSKLKTNGGVRQT